MPALSLISIQVNGVWREIDAGSRVADLLDQLGLRRELVAVELNRQLVRKVEFDDRRLSSGDRVEIVEFVGGG